MHTWFRGLFHTLTALSLLSTWGACSSSSSGRFGDDGGASGSGGSDPGGGNGGNGGGGDSGGNGGKGGSAGSAGQANGGSAGKGSGGDGGSAGSGGSAGTEVLPACVEQRLADMGGSLARVDTPGRTDAFSASCTAGTAPDVAFVWAAPEADYYAIDSFGSDFDTTLAIYDGCGGNELACNDNASAANPQSQIVRLFEPGQDVIIAVDGNSGETGEAVVNIERVTCPETDLAGQTFPAALSTATGTNGQAGLCGGSGIREKTYRYIPAEPGFYRFSVGSDAIAPALHLETGAQCGGELLQCNAGFSGSYPSEITRYLAAGQPVTLIVDSTSGEGNFDLDIKKLTNTTCAESVRVFPEIGQDVVDYISDADSDLLSSSCQAAGGIVGSPSPFREHRFALDVTQDLTSCYYTFYSDGPLTASLVRGPQCDGPEARCLQSVANVDTDIFPDYTEMLTVTFAQADIGEYVLSLETPWADGFPINYTLVITCVA